MDKKTKAAVEKTLERYRQMDKENQQAMYDSITAVHGADAGMAVGVVWSLHDAVAHMSQAFIETTSMEEDRANKILERVDSVMDGMSRVVFHLATVGHVPECTPEMCNCAKEAKELNKMFTAMINSHLEARVRCNGEIKRHLS